MLDSEITGQPALLTDLLEKCDEIGFTMPSDLYIGTLLKTLITSRPNSNFLELGTGIGLSLAWMVDGMDMHSRIISVDNDPQLSKIARNYFGTDPRVEIVCADGTDWILNYSGDPFDLVFADAWPGKYSELDEMLKWIRPGGFYIVDDLNAQSNWPEGHGEKVRGLVKYLESREDFHLTKMNWSTGIIIASKKS